MDKVIIDGVDVSECPFYEYKTEEDYEMRYPESGYCEIGLAGYLFNYSRITEEIEKDCIDNHNCFFKQLQRAKAENEQLKEEKGGRQILIDNYIALTEKYHQALQEIRDIAENEYYAVDPDARYITDKILDKINSVIGAE